MTSFAVMAVGKYYRLQYVEVGCLPSSEVSFCCCDKTLWATKITTWKSRGLCHFTLPDHIPPLREISAGSQSRSPRGGWLAGLCSITREFITERVPGKPGAVVCWLACSQRCSASLDIPSPPKPTCLKMVRFTMEKESLNQSLFKIIS